MFVGSMKRRGSRRRSNSRVMMGAQNRRAFVRRYSGFGLRLLRGFYASMVIGWRGFRRMSSLVGAWSLWLMWSLLRRLCTSRGFMMHQWRGRRASGEAVEVQEKGTGRNWTLMGPEQVLAGVDVLRLVDLPLALKHRQTDALHHWPKTQRPKFQLSSSELCRKSSARMS